MARSFFKRIRKLIEVTLRPGQAWRRDLFLLRRAIDNDESGSSPRIERALDRLSRRAERYPAALRPLVVQQRRIARSAEGLSLVERLWRDGDVDDAKVALGCAQVWYDLKILRKGDVALERAKELDSGLLTIYVEEAKNQRWRGNASAALEAAEISLRLSANENARKYWTLFAGELQFELGHNDQAIELMQRGLPASPSENQRYRLGLALENAGRSAEARDLFSSLTLDQELPAELRVAGLHYARKNYANALASLEGLPDSLERTKLLALTQVMLGQPEEVLEAIAPLPHSTEIAEIRAFACELAGEQRQAVTEYRALVAQFAGERIPRRILRRAARSAFLAGYRLESAQLELLRGPEIMVVDPKVVELHPGYAELVIAANSALANRDFPLAASHLERLANSSSNIKNARRALRLLGFALGQLGRMEAAAEAFFHATRFPLPHADELLLRCRDNFPGEHYSEFWETLPVRDDVVLYETFHGASTACNPLAICRELLAAGERKLQHVWVINEGATIHPELRDRANVHFVQRGSWGYYRHLASAKYLVNNTTFPPRFLRRPEQVYVNTWHGTPWKYLGRDIIEAPYGHDNAGRNFLQATHLILPNAHTADTLVRTHDIRNLLVHRPLVIGSPRVDTTLALDAARRIAIEDELGLDPKSPVVLYAPTWRGALGALQLDPAPFVAAIEALASREVTVLVRFHHLLTRAIDMASLPSNVVVVPDSVDTNELLALIDVLVSDYSSIIFDFAPTNRPIIKHVFDLEAYTAERGLYFDVDEVPGLRSETVDELGSVLDQIVSEEAPVPNWATSPLNNLWVTEDGGATQRAIEAMFAPIPDPVQPERDTVLINLSGLRANGVTRSLRNLLASSSPSRAFNVQVLVPKASLDTEQARETAAELHESADLSLYTGLLVGTRQETVAWRLLQDLRTTFPQASLRWVRSRMQRERRRYFGEAGFVATMDFDGYVSAQAGLVGLGFPEETTSVYVAHSEFVPELKSRFPKHKQIGSFIGEFDRIASVSDGAMRVNQRDLAEEFGVPRTKHVALPNTLDIDGIIESSTRPLDAELANWFAVPRTHVIVVARLSVEKNHASVVEALAEVTRAGIDLDLVFLGSGPRRRSLEVLAADLGVSDRVLLAGHRDNPYPAIAQADAMLLPSTHEGQGLVLFEGMVLGVPLVASNVTGPASVLDNGKHGLLVEPTVAGMSDALNSIARGDVPKSQLDVRDYQDQALRTFYALVGH